MADPSTLPPAINAQTERLRLGALRNYKILDTPREEAFDRIVRLARRALRAPVAQIAFVDRDRAWLKASDGIISRDIPRGTAFAARVIESDAPLIVPDARADARFATVPVVEGEPFIRSYMGVPLRTPVGLRIGALGIMDTAVRTPDADDIAILQDLALVAMDALELRLVATTDALTGALSRLSFFNAAARDITEARRKPRDLSCILLDLDHFKAVNEAYGHAVGDRVLQELVVRLRADLRADGRGEDYIGRLGSEEFAILLSGAGRIAARDVGERLRRSIMEADFTVPDGTVKLTVSMGVASLNHADAGVEDLLRRADDALYAAKTAGRNRLVSDPPVPPVLVVK